MQAKGLKAWTIRGALTVVGCAFNFAVRRLGWAGQNPVRLLDRSERPRSDAKPRRILTGEELHAVLSAAADPHRLIFRFAAGTGCRLGEVLGLRWQAIDFDTGTAAITHQLDRQGCCVELKTQRSRREIELPGWLLSELRTHKIASAHSADHQYVFTSQAGTPNDHRNVAGRALTRAVEASGIDTEQRPAPTFHSFRHGFASAFIAAGGDLVELSAHLGHSDPRVTASVYAQEFERAARSDARRSRIEGMYGPRVGSAPKAVGSALASELHATAQ